MLLRNSSTETYFGTTLKVEGKNELAFARFALAHEEDAVTRCPFLKYETSGIRSHERAVKPRIMPQRVVKIRSTIYVKRNHEAAKRMKNVCRYTVITVDT